jgi:hypothetical protein
MSATAEKAAPTDKAVQDFLRKCHFHERLERFIWEHRIGGALCEAGFSMTGLKRDRDLGMYIATGKSSISSEARRPTALVSRIVYCLRSEGLDADADYVSVYVTSNARIVVTVGVREVHERTHFGSHGERFLAVGTAASQFVRKK